MSVKGMINELGMKVESITVSNSFDTHRGGEKSNHFVSMNFHLEHPLGSEESALAHMLASKMVTKAVIQQACARGALTVEEANERIKDVMSNHDAILENLMSKVKKD